MILLFCIINFLHYSHRRYLYVRLSLPNIYVIESSRSTDVVWHPLNLSLDICKCYSVIPFSASLSFFILPTDLLLRTRKARKNTLSVFDMTM